jgi:hypothetical protein
VAKAEAAQGQTTINQKAVAIAAETVLVTAELLGSVAVASGNGDGGNGGDNVAAMAAVMANMAPTVAEGSADVGGGHLSYFLLFLHNRRIRTDVITVKLLGVKVFCGKTLSKHF